MALVVRAFPVLPGKEEDVRRLSHSLATERAGGIARFFAAFGVRHESWHLQETPHGPWVIVVSDIDEPDARGQQYSAALGEFEAWFKGRVLELSGIDPTVQPLGPPTETVFSWPAPDVA